MISLRRLTKRYGKHAAVDDVSLEIIRGEVVGLLGPNGAGKTTTLRMLTGSLRPTSGSVVIDGIEMEEEPARAKSAIGYMPENAPLYGDMRVDEYLLFRARLMGLPVSTQRKAIERALGDLDIVDAARTRISHLSKGYRQRVSFASAVLGRPRVVVLDEPTSGLDPNQVAVARSLLRELAKDSAIVVSSHILKEVEATASRIVILHHGKIVADEAHEPSPVQSASPETSLEAKFRKLTNDAESAS